MAFVTFPEYVWAKNAEEKFQISLLVFPIWRLENGHPTAKRHENPMLWGNFVSKAHINKIGNNIQITRSRCHAGNKYGGQKAEVVSADPVHTARRAPT